MADKLTPERRSWNMSRIRGKNTKPELLVRRLLHAKGYRYRLHGTARGGQLPGNPDLVFAGRHKVIFVNGCFWHFHDCRVGQHAPQGQRRVLGNQAHPNPEPRRRPAASARARGLGSPHRVGVRAEGSYPRWSCDWTQFLRASPRPANRLNPPENIR